MIRVAQILILFSIVGGAFWYGYHKEENTNIFKFVDNIKDVLYQENVCLEPIPYKIGSFNEEFKVSEEYFLQAIKDAEEIWEEPFDRNFFVYEPLNSDRDVLEINLTYDYRQQVTEELAKLDSKVSSGRESYEALELRVSAMKDKYLAEKNYLEAEISSWNDRREVLEKEIDYWNSRGGAGESDYNRLEAERIVLDKEAKVLNQKEEKLNQLAFEVNALVSELNNLAKTLNVSVKEFNEVALVHRGETFEEGLYRSDESGRAIDVFEFSSREKLVRLLAHEFGHALGVLHTEDPESIMYSLNQSKKLALSNSDIQELERICRDSWSR